MPRLAIMLSLFGLFVVAPASAQRIDNTTPQAQSGTPPQAPLPRDAQVPSGSPQGPPSPDAKENVPPKKSSKVKRTLQKAAPDCISIIFHTCHANSAREQEAEEALEVRRARAVERCKLLQAARPATAEPRKTELPPGESSSKASIPNLSSTSWCNPEDVLAAEHDVEVGDFNLKDKNERGAEMRYRSALERIPGDPIATLRLAQLLDKQGKNAQAYEQYKIYMSWSPTGADADEATSAMERFT